MNIRDYLTSHHVSFEPIAHKATQAARQLAMVLDPEPAQVVKSVLVHADERFVLCVVPASRSVDLHAVGEILDADRVTIASEGTVGMLFPDCEVGAITPFGSQYGMLTLLDASLVGGGEIVFDAQSHREAVKMRCEDFERLEQPRIANIARREPRRTSTSH